MADARTLPLPLVGSGDHDWEILFGQWDLLLHDQKIGGIIRASGMAWHADHGGMVCVATLGGACRIAWTLSRRGLRSASQPYIFLVDYDTLRIRVAGWPRYSRIHLRSDSMSTTAVTHDARPAQLRSRSVAAFGHNGLRGRGQSRDRRVAGAHAAFECRRCGRRSAGRGAAFPAWRRTPPGERIQYLFKLKNLLEEHHRRNCAADYPGKRQNAGGSQGGDPARHRKRGSGLRNSR